MPIHDLAAPVQLLPALLCGALLSLAAFPVASHFVKKESRGKAAGLQKKHKIITMICGGLACAAGLPVLVLIPSNALTILFFIVFLYILLVISCVDLATRAIPEICQLALLMLAAVSALPHLRPGPGVLERLLGAVIISVPLLVVALLTKGMGGGDIKLFAVLGLLLGWKMLLLSFMISVVTAAIFGLILSKMRGEDLKSVQIAFAPFICFGAYIAYCFGSMILSCYMALFKL